MATNGTAHRKQKLAVLSDGTWCGKETGTTTNVSLLATMMGINVNSPTKNYTVTRPGIKARYFEGCGLNDTFLAYLFNGATGNDIARDVIEIYRYIVDNYEENTELWFFGHSRGSFTVRCVAGLINNCGIIKKRGTEEQTDMLCQEVYKLYRSPNDDEAPASAKMIKFRKEASWDLKGVPAIKFMGLIDTVGALGIPKLDVGAGFSWPEFHDQDISGEVEKVYHAQSLHDRLWVFQPCRARRNPETEGKRREVENNHDVRYEIHEKWFPGCHYDVGRQRFKFLRMGGSPVEQFFFRIPDLLTSTIIPNGVCADMVLLWLLRGLQTVEEGTPLIGSLDDEIETFEDRLMNQTGELGTGDVYGRIPDFAPGGIVGHAFGLVSNFVVKVTNNITPSLKLGSAIQDFLGIRTLLNILLATRDRRILGENDTMVMPMTVEQSLGGVSAYEKVGWGRYKSKTFESFQAYRRAIGSINEQEFIALVPPAQA